MSNYKMYYKSFFSFIFLILNSYFSFAQIHDVGDEDKTMSNIVAENRDKKVVEEAKSGWWKESMIGKEERLKWWREARFGMFIHWGVYSEAGGEWKGKEVGGYAEHLMRKEKISRQEYLELASKFNPVYFNADHWVKSAKEAGMHYFVVTAKHHDGFAMYPSDVSDFNITKQSLFKRDPMAELAAACKKYGLKFGFYYSHAFDWENPDAPGNDWEYNNPGGDKNLFGGRNWFDHHPELIPKAQKYVTEKSIPQIIELINKYQPDMFWFDTPHKLPLSENLRILKAIRETDPNLVINGRLARSSDWNFGDYLNTADRPAEFFPVIGDWEAIPTTNESYGFSKYDNSHKPASHFIKLLANGVARGGNILMNIGPKGDGSFDSRDQVILDSIAVWMKKYESSIHKTSKSPLPLQSWGAITKKDSLLYLHILKWPKNNQLLIGGLKSKVARVYDMNGLYNTELKTAKTKEGNLIIKLPNKKVDKVDAVFIMELAEPVKSENVRFIDLNDNETRLLAFDATLHGEGLLYGDGKANKFFVNNWTNNTQYLEWTFNTTKAKRVKLNLKFVNEKANFGTFKIYMNDKVFEGEIPNNSFQEGEIFDQFIGVTKLKKGKNTIMMKADDIRGQELMKLLELNLSLLK
jgi:alpha-L-fucosidase